MVYCEQRTSCFLETHLASPPFLIPEYASERRLKPRAKQNLPARVWGVNSHDEAISFDCEVLNISSSGVYLSLSSDIKFLSSISIVVHLFHGRAGGLSAAIKGRVVRIERNSPGRNGVAVLTREFSFLKDP